MAELRAPEQNRLLGQLANMLRTTEGDIAAPEFLPRGLDVMGLVRQLMLPSAETVEKLSYGDPLFRMPTQSNIPITADREYLADIAGMIPFGAPAARPSARAMQDLVRQIQTEPPIGSIKPTASSARAKVAQSDLIGPFYHASPKPDIDEFRATTKQERKETGSGDPRGVFFTQDPEYASGYGRYLYETYIPRKAITWNTSGTEFFDKSTEAIVPQEFADMVQINRVIDLRDQDLPPRPEWWYESYRRGLLDEPAQSVVNPFQSAFAEVSPGDKVAGLTVREDVPNMGSIGASLDNYEILSGIRKVPAKAFDAEYLDSLRTRGLDKRTSDLSEQIKQSKEINPLIVAVDNQGAYIIEGGHRFDALMTQGRDSVPAKVVIDQDNPPTEDFLRSLFE